MKKLFPLVVFLSFGMTTCAQKPDNVQIHVNEHVVNVYYLTFSSNEEKEFISWCNNMVSPAQDSLSFIRKELDNLSRVLDPYLDKRTAVLTYVIDSASNIVFLNDMPVEQAGIPSFYLGLIQQQSKLLWSYDSLSRRYISYIQQAIDHYKILYPADQYDLRLILPSKETQYFSCGSLFASQE